MTLVEYSWANAVSQVADGYVEYLEKMTGTSISIVHKHFTFYRNVNIAHHTMPGTSFKIVAEQSLLGNGDGFNDIHALNTDTLNPNFIKYEDYSYWRDWAEDSIQLNEKTYPRAKYICGTCDILTNSGTIQIEIDSVVSEPSVFFYKLRIKSPCGYDGVFNSVSAYWREAKKPTANDLCKHLASMLRTCGKL